MAEKAVQELERIYTIPLRKVASSPNNHQVDRAVRFVRDFLKRHMKTDEVWIDASVNEALWARGMYQAPRRIRVRARRFDDGVVEVSLPERESGESIRGDLKARQEAAQEPPEEKDEAKEDEEKSSTKDKTSTEPRPQGIPVIDVEGIGPTYAKKLNEQDVFTMSQLRTWDPAELAKKTGISETRIVSWQGMADLDRLATVGNQYAELLFRAGVNNLVELAEQEPETLVKKIDDYLATVETPPTQEPYDAERAKAWIEEAKKVTASGQKDESEAASE